MKINPLEIIKENIAKLLEKSASKEYSEGSFWADPKKRNTIIAVVGLFFAWQLSSALPEQKVRTVSSVDDSYNFAVRDLTGNEKRQRPTVIFSESGADKLNALESEDLVKAMNSEMKFREKDMSMRETAITKESADKDQEIEDMHMQNQEKMRELQAKNKSQLKTIKANSRQEAQRLINALANGEDPSGIIKGLKIPDGLSLASADTRSPSSMQPVILLGHDGKPQNRQPQYISGTRRNSGTTRNVQAGLRVISGAGNYRVATGQTLDLNNQQSMQKMANQTGNDTLVMHDDVFARLKIAKNELHLKRKQLAEQQEIEETERLQSEIIKSNIVSLTAGSVLSGTLINGMYVPTSSGISNEPIPAIFRIKKEAVMPNYFVSSEVVECVIVAAARPAVESIRVVFRASTITCIRDDGTATEDKIMATSSGPDGATGVPAILISRNGEMLAKTATAGFLKGLTDVFSQTSIEVNSEDGVFALSGADVAKMTGSAALGGAGDALTRLADYYMSLADKMQPTLLVNPGIEVDFIVTSLTVIDFNKK